MNQQEAIGIDFGTSTTIAAIASAGNNELFADPAAAKVMDPADPNIIPTFVSFKPNGEVLAGRAAKLRGPSDPANTIHSFKRIIGLPWKNSDVALFVKWYKAEITEGARSTPHFVTRAGPLNSVDIASYLFAYLREHSEVARRTNAAVVTVPPSFRDKQRGAIAQAAARAGFTETKLLSEAYAAALPYVADEKEDGIVFVYDLGGGTFDAAVIRCNGQGHEELATGGDPYLGGDDIDVRLADWVVSEVLAGYQWDLRTDLSQYKKLIWACERAKITLSTDDVTELDLGGIDSVLAGKTVPIQRRYLEKLMYDLAQRTFAVCDEVLRAAKLRTADVDRVVLAGGGSFIPYIREAVATYFGKQPSGELPANKLVAIGAGIAAAKGMGTEPPG